MLMHTGLMSTDRRQPDPRPAGAPDSPQDSAEARAAAPAGFLDLILADRDLLDAEFQELIGRIPPPSRPGATVLAPPAGWGRGRLPFPGRSWVPRPGTYSSRTPLPARERSPP